jgi:hypothetical protein
MDPFAVVLGWPVGLADLWCPIFGTSTGELRHALILQSHNRAGITNVKPICLGQLDGGRALTT